MPNTMQDAAKRETAIRKLQADNAKLLRQLDEAKSMSRDLVAAVYRAARKAADQVTYRPVAAPRAERRKDDPETAILLVSDWQLGKRTPTYSTEVCAKRIALYADRVRRLVGIQRADRPIRKAVVCLLGDLVEGETIFPGQAWRVDASLFRQVLLDGPEILGTLLRDLLNYFEEVEVHDVVGNHGRIGRRGDYHPETNADAMLYHATHQQLRGEARLRWLPNYQPGERAWYRVFSVGRNAFFCFHGDQMRGGGFAGIPMYGFIRAIMSWASGTLPQQFRYGLCGHWHSMWSIPVNQTHEGLARILWVNGSTESGNTWLQEEIKAQNPPGQWLMFAHDRRGVTVEHRVWLA